MINRLLFFLLIFALNLFGQVNLNLPNEVIKNQSFLFSIEIVGSEVEFPIINEIDGFNVQEVSSSTSTTIINSKIMKKIKKVYSFLPKNDFIFPSLKFKIDGKEEYTLEKKFKLISPSKTKSDIFDLQIKTSKSDLYVGENFILTVILKYKKNLQIIDISLDKPNFKDFWYKQLDDSKQFHNKEYIVHELKFLMMPLKYGNLEIEPLLVSTQLIDTNRPNDFSFFNDITKSLKIYSNKLNFNIKALPENIKLIGDFKISSSINKNTINKGDAISYKIKIEGKGNIEDIPDIKLNLKDTTIYENKPIIKSEVYKQEVIGSYEKVFSILPNGNLEIPPFKLKYFDKNKNEIKEIESKRYKIKVLNKNKIVETVNLEKSQKKVEKVEKVKIVNKTLLEDKIIYFCLGILVTLILFIIYFYAINKKRDKQVYNSSLLKKVKNTKNNHELLKILAVYINLDEDLDKLILNIEKNDNITVLKKDILKKIKELKL